VTNFFAPAFRVEINGSQLQADVSKNIQQVQVVNKPDTLDTFSLTLANTLPKMRWTHTSDADLFQLGSSVKIAFGYVDDLQAMIEGEINQISPTFPASGTPTVTIQGQTLLHRLADYTKPRTFQKATDKEMANTIADDATLGFDAEETDIQYDYVIKGNQSDLEFLKERAARIHFEILVKDKTLIFRKAKEAETKTYTLVWTQIQKGFTMANTLPLKSFSPQLDASQPVTSTEHRAYDVKSKKAFICRAGPDDQAAKMGGTQKAADVVTGSFQRTRELRHGTSPFTTQAEGDQHARAAFNQRALKLIGGSGATLGVPDLRSGQVVELQGLGSVFSGCYYIDEATHCIDGSGYQTSFTVKRNAK
jgi:Bacteriophage probable baseplate hub protein